MLLMLLMLDVERESRAGVDEEIFCRAGESRVSCVSCDAAQAHSHGSHVFSRRRSLRCASHTCLPSPTIQPVIRSFCRHSARIQTSSTISSRCLKSLIYYLLACNTANSNSIRTLNRPTSVFVVSSNPSDMATLNLSANGPSISSSYRSVVNAPAPSGPAANSPTYGQWSVFSVSTPLVNAFQQNAPQKESVLKVQSTGGTDTPALH